MLAARFLSPDSLTQILAYVAYYKPNFLSGRSMSPTHLRALCQRLGHPHLNVRSVRAQPLLAVHLAVGHAARLLTVSEGFWQISLDALPWLEAPRPTQVAHLYEALKNEHQWAESLAVLGLQDFFAIDYLAYITQQLARQQNIEETPPTKSVWLPSEKATEWRLALPTQIPPHLLFHLWQIGYIDENNVWLGTPFSIARAAQQGYSLTLISSVITRLLDKPLDPQRQNELVQWYQRHDAYRVRGGYILSVKQPAELDEIMQQQRWRPHIGERLSSRHALVSPSLTPLLARRLQVAGYPLDAPQPPDDSSKLNETPHIDPATYYLALEVLRGLGKIIQLPFSLPGREIDEAYEWLSLGQQADLELKIIQVLDGVKDAIRGRDAYFLPEGEPDPALIDSIEAAIAQEKVIEIAYQALGESVPRLRQVEPHWLERRAVAIYLHGYCFLAEANRVFRLDRIHHWKSDINMS